MKKLLILLGLFGIVAIVFLAFIFMARDDDGTPIVTPTPTTTEIGGVVLLRSIPDDNASNVGIDQEVSFTFSDVVTEEDITVFVGPNTGHAVLYRGKTVVVRPIPSWNAGTPYRISLQYKDLSRVPAGINFQTIGQEVESLPDTAPNPTEIKASEDLQREASPDAYLSNYTPYENDSFRITSRYKSAPNGHFAFTVTIKNGSSETVIRNQVKAWTANYGLSEAQFNSLDISFQ